MTQSENHVVTLPCDLRVHHTVCVIERCDLLVVIVVKLKIIW